MNELRQRWRQSSNIERIAYLRSLPEAQRLDILDSMIFPETEQELQEFITTEYERMMNWRGRKPAWFHDRERTHNANKVSAQTIW